MFEITDSAYSEELEIVPEIEAEAIETIEDAEPLKAAYEMPEDMSDPGYIVAAEVETEIPAPMPIIEEPVPAVSSVPWNEMIQTAPTPEEVPIIEEAQRVELPPFPLEKIEGWLMRWHKFQGNSAGSQMPLQRFRDLSQN